MVVDGIGALEERRLAGAKGEARRRASAERAGCSMGSGSGESVDAELQSCPSTGRIQSVPPLAGARYRAVLRPFQPLDRT